MSLQSIYISGFKSIRELDFELRPLNVLIGANGSGKSNFILVFEMLNAIIDKRLQTFSGRYGAETLLYFGYKTTQTIKLELAFDRGSSQYQNGYVVELVPSNRNTLIFESEGVWFHDRSQYSQHGPTLWIGYGNSETELYKVSSQTDRRLVVDYVIAALSDWRVYHFHDTSASAPVKATHNINDNDYLRSDASNLAAFLYRLRETRRPCYDRIVKSVALVAPFFEDFALRPNPLNENNIRLEWREKGSDAYFDGSMFSDGTLRFICLATLLLQPELPSVILIDEPELGLHPYAITQLAGLLRSASKQTQVIVSTQSVPLINQFTPEDIVVVDRRNGQSEFQRLESDQLTDWLKEYGLGDLWEKNVLGGRPQLWEPHP